MFRTCSARAAENDWYWSLKRVVTIRISHMFSLDSLQWKAVALTKVIFKKIIFPKTVVIDLVTPVCLHFGFKNKQKQINLRLLLFLSFLITYFFFFFPNVSFQMSLIPRNKADLMVNHLFWYAIHKASSFA